jgi:hypothetical protein
VTSVPSLLVPHRVTVAAATAIAAPLAGTAEQLRFPPPL